MSTPDGTSTGSPKPPHAVYQASILTQSLPPGSTEPAQSVSGVAGGDGSPGGEVGANPKWFSKTCADLHAPLSAEIHSSDESEAAFGVFKTASLLWEIGQEVTYSFMEGKFQGNEIQRQKVTTTILEWERYANIKFKLVDNCGDLRIAFNGNGGSWSFVGTQNLETDYAKATMNLGWIGKVNADITPEERGTILHEFGHALGLLHEHQSPSRANGLKLNEAAIYDFYNKGQNWSRELVKSQIIDLYGTHDISNYSELDTQSIMTYFMPAKMNEKGLEIPPNDELPALDKAYAILNYPPLDSSSSVNHTAARGSDPIIGDWTLSRALQVAGVPPHTSAEILGPHHHDDVRKLFTEWAAKNITNHELIAPGGKAPGDLTPSMASGKR